MNHGTSQALTGGDVPPGVPAENRKKVGVANELTVRRECVWVSERVESLSGV